MYLPSKSRFAFQQSVEAIPVNRKGHIYLWTFTFKECIDVDIARKAWSAFLKHLRQWKKRRGGAFHGFRVFELHPGGHGLHIHVVTSCYWFVNEIRALWQHSSIGGGRVNAKPIPANRAKYAGKYLSKAGRSPCFRGARMWQAFGGQEYTRVKDVKVESNWTRAYAYLKATVRTECGITFAKMRWWQRILAVENVLRGLPWNWSMEFRPSFMNDANDGIDISRN